MKEIKIWGARGIGKVALVDDEDFELLNEVRWNLSAKGYAAYHDVRMHRFLLRVKDGQYVDHINGNPLDNRKSNLRLATIQQNSFNRRKLKKASSIYKGVSWSKQMKQWAVFIEINNKSTLIGYFEKEKEAALAYDLWANDLFGGFARLNFKKAY